MYNKNIIKTLLNRVTCVHYIAMWTTVVNLLFTVKYFGYKI